ncbi:MAG: sulfurase, partial [Pseudomonadota bacterium]
MLSLAELTARTAHTGSVVWLGIRPGRHAEVRSLPSVWIGPGGLQGDHRARPGKRAVSLIQAEHLTVISALSGAPEVTFEMLRRNIAVSGLNLAAMRGRSVRIGTCELSIAG